MSIAASSHVESSMMLPDLPNRSYWAHDSWVSANLRPRCARKPPSSTNTHLPCDGALENVVYFDSTSGMVRVPEGPPVGGVNVPIRFLARLSPCSLSALNNSHAPCPKGKFSMSSAVLFVSISTPTGIGIQRSGVPDTSCVEAFVVPAHIVLGAAAGQS